MNYTNTTRFTKDERGMASFLITIFIMTVLALIVLGFSQLARRDQRQSLDRQLSVQANYAAEAGLNDARQYLRSNPLATINDCAQAGTISPSGNVLGDNVSYSCVLINPSPSNLEFEEVPRNFSKIFPITSANGTSINRINIAWQNAGGGPVSFAGCPAIAAQPALWPGGCTTGMLRVDIVFLRPGAFNRNSVIGSNAAATSDTATFFLTPTADGNTYNFDNANTAGTSALGVFAGASGGCAAGNTPKACSRDIFLNPGYSGTQYYIRLRSLYIPSAVTITARDSGGASLPLSGAQAAVDATGKAGDVLKRIQARVPINAFGEAPEFSMFSRQSMCKRFGLVPPSTFMLEAGYNDINNTHGCKRE